MSSPSPVPSSGNKPIHPLASKIMSSVKRSFTPSSQKRRNHPSTNPAHSGDVPIILSPYRQDNKSRAPPSVGQIAMGLHVSRTPHLRPLSSSQNSPYPPKHTGFYPTHSRPTSASSNHETTPRRSSLKKFSAPAASRSSMSHSNLSTTSASLSTVTSNTISTPRSSRSFSFRRLRVPWLSSGSSALPPSTNSLGEATEHIPRKKAVRFTGHIPNQDVD